MSLWTASERGGESIKRDMQAIEGMHREEEPIVSSPLERRRNKNWWEPCGFASYKATDGISIKVLQRGQSQAAGEYKVNEISGSIDSGLVKLMHKE